MKVLAARDAGAAELTASVGSGRQLPKENILIGAPHQADGLTACALAYLALPNLIFLFGWFRTSIALLLGAGMCYFVVAAFQSAPIRWRSAHSPAALLIVFATSCIWSAFGGGSHFMYANPDWYIRDAVLGDLINFGWPLHYFSTEGMPLILRSAIGFFLPPALFGKLFGLAHLDLAVYVWTIVGVLIFLLLLPLPRRTGWRLALALILVVFFSGMDFLGVVIATESMPIFPLRLEWWVPLSYPSLTNQLLWAPNHCLPIWIATLLYFRHRHGAEFLRVMVATLPLTLIWTPFAVIGLLPFAWFGTVDWIRKFAWTTVPWRAIIVASVYSLPIVAFLVFDIGHIHSGVATAPSATSISYPLQGASLHSYILFVSCEFLLLALVIAPHVREARPEFWLSIVILLALPLLRFGPSNDFGLRLSTTPLVFLLVICLQTLLAEERPSLRGTRWIACLFLAIGAHTAFNEFWRAATFPRTPPDYQHTLADRQNGQPAAHYVGRYDASPIRHWLRPLPETRTDRE